MTRCLFATDLHGRRPCYTKLIRVMEQEHPDGVLLGGDLLPSGFGAAQNGEVERGDFLEDFLAPALSRARESMGDHFPSILVIQGNDDPMCEQRRLLQMEEAGLWRVLNQKRAFLGRYEVFGYPYVPPTPFALKDWERYDVSRYVDPGCVSPEEGYRTVDILPGRIRYSTIEADLKELAEGRDMDRAVFLFHSPPYQSVLDRADLDGKMIDHVPLDLHVGSIAIRRFIEEHQPLVTFHGHVHESSRITGQWKQQLGRTTCIGGAHDGAQLALVQLELGSPELAKRRLL